MSYMTYVCALSLSRVANVDVCGAADTPRGRYLTLKKTLRGCVSG